MREINKRGYKRTEFVFDQVARNLSNGEDDISRIKKVLADFDLKGKSVLEVGCGLGDNLIYCARRGAGYVEGFDISGESIGLARSKAKDYANIFFHKKAIEDYKTEKRFDLILAIGVFEYLDYPLRSLEKVSGLLKDKGVIILVVSRPLLLKKISFLCRAILSRMPRKISLPTARLLGGFFRRFGLVFGARLLPANSNTYTHERMIMEGLMVPRYNICDQNRLQDYLEKTGFSVDIIEGVWPSMTCIMAKI